MRIGEVAQQAGVTVKAVRYYESLGLVEAQRLDNGYRDYDDHDVRLVHEIRALGTLGIRAELSRPFLDCLVSGNAQGDDCPASLDTYRSAITDMSSRINDLTERRDALIALLASATGRGEPLCDLTPTELQGIR
ncbi:MAG: thiol-specific antioxidant related protein/peroxidoxin BcpB [Aeromicrobium sp.]|jgi:DNA-binding transcriptional MerR regulator|nr:thiol-specific antioxidant related protein/peroxidoxin BcpB [Aeromicrobium sp.]